MNKYEVFIQDDILSETWFRFYFGSEQSKPALDAVRRAAEDHRWVTLRERTSNADFAFFPKKVLVEYKDGVVVQGPVQPPVFVKVADTYWPAGYYLGYRDGQRDARQGLEPRFTYEDGNLTDYANGYRSGYAGPHVPAGKLRVEVEHGL